MPSRELELPYVVKPTGETTTTANANPSTNDSSSQVSGLQESPRPIEIQPRMIIELRNEGDSVLKKVTVKVMTTSTYRGHYSTSITKPEIYECGRDGSQLVKGKEYSQFCAVIDEMRHVTDSNGDSNGNSSRIEYHLDVRERGAADSINVEVFHEDSKNRTVHVDVFKNRPKAHVRNRFLDVLDRALPLIYLPVLAFIVIRLKRKK